MVGVKREFSYFSFIMVKWQYFSVWVNLSHYQLTCAQSPSIPGISGRLRNQVLEAVGSFLCLPQFHSLTHSPILPFGKRCLGKRGKPSSTLGTLTQYFKKWAGGYTWAVNGGDPYKGWARIGGFISKHV